MSLVHGGASFQIFGEAVYGYMVGKDPADLIVNTDEVPDMETRELLQQVGSLLFKYYYLCVIIIL